MPRYPVPVASIGRLAVDRRKRGRGLGSALLADAFPRIIRAGEALAIHAFIVDAVETPRNRQGLRQNGRSRLNTRSALAIVL